MILPDIHAVCNLYVISSDVLRIGSPFSNAKYCKNG